MTDPIQHLRKLHYQCVAPGGADCASDVRRYKYQMDLLRHVPALLAVAEAALILRDGTTPRQAREANLWDALAKLYEVNHD